MSKINIIIIDDEPGCIELLWIMLQNTHTEMVLLDTAQSVEKGLAVVNKHRQQIDLLFLDIQMPGGDGFLLLQQLQHIPFKIIFTTAFDHFALKAIKFSALDYLLKPVESGELQHAVDKFLKEDNAKRQRMLDNFKHQLDRQNLFNKLAVATLNEVSFIPIDKITYLESDNNYTTIFSEGRQRLVSSKNLGYYEELLAGNGFYRVSNSCLVNLKKINRFIKGKSGSIALEGGETLNVSASKKERLLQLMGMD